MLKSACSSSLGAGAGGAIAPVACRRRRSGSSSSSSVLRAGAEKEPEVTVFDAEGGVSWEDYKKQKPDEYKVRHTLFTKFFMRHAVMCLLHFAKLIHHLATSRSRCEYEQCCVYVDPELHLHQYFNSRAI